MAAGIDAVDVELDLGCVVNAEPLVIEPTQAQSILLATVEDVKALNESKVVEVEKLTLLPEVTAGQATIASAKEKDAGVDLKAKTEDLKVQSPNVVVTSQLVQEKEDTDEVEFQIPVGKTVQEDDDADFDFDIPQKASVISTVNTCMETDGENNAEKEEYQLVIPTLVEKEREENVVEISQEPTSQIAPAAAVVNTVNTPEHSVVISQDSIEQSQPVVHAAALSAAQAEWENVQTITPAFQEEGVAPLAAGEKKLQTPIVSYKEGLDYCRGANMFRFRDQVKTSVQHHGFAALKHFLFGPPKLSRNLQEDRDLLFCIAACPLDNDESIHTRMLQTIYKRLTGSKFDCSRFGSHWEQIGFQGNDPATDLRGCGLLGLLNLLYLVTTPDTLDLARDIYKLSQHETQNFPFCVMSINLTRIMVQTLREDSLNRECNKSRDVMETVHQFYVGLYLHMYNIWKQKNKTISDSGFVIKEIEVAKKKKVPTATLR